MLNVERTMNGVSKQHPSTTAALQNGTTKARQDSMTSALQYLFAAAARYLRAARQHFALQQNRSTGCK